MDVAVPGPVTCGSWIRRPEKVNWVILATSGAASAIQVFSFDPKTSSLSSSPLASHELKKSDGTAISIAVHPSGDHFACSTTNGGCKFFDLIGTEEHLKLLLEESSYLHDVGPQNCIQFSVDGSKFAAGGVDGHLRILEWPSQRIILDEARAHKSFRDLDFSLDSEYVASTSTDGLARIWKIEDGVPLTSLTHNSDEKIELCRFSKDGTKPFLFCSVQRGDKALIAVYDMSTWSKIGHKRLMRKPASIMSVSLDGKYLALGSKDGDICVAEVKKMEILHWSKRLHLGASISSLEFCPTERVVLTTSCEWGPMVTNLTVPPDWKEWQIYLLLLGLFLASAVAFYMFFQNSSLFWNLPGRQPVKTVIDAFPQSDDQNMFGAFGPLEM